MAQTGGAGGVNGDRVREHDDDNLGPVNAQ